jgi:hypothetical protein
LVKLVTGEVLIAGIADTTNPHENGGIYTLECPMTIMHLPTRKKKGSKTIMETTIFMKNWMEFSQDEMYIVPKSAVICISMPDSTMVRDYHSAKANFDYELDDVQDENERRQDDEFGDGEGGEDDDHPPPPFE